MSVVHAVVLWSGGSMLESRKMVSLEASPVIERANLSCDVGIGVPVRDWSCEAKPTVSGS